MRYTEKKIISFDIEIYGGTIIFANNVTIKQVIKSLESETGKDIVSEDFIEYLKDKQDSLEPQQNCAITVSNGFFVLILLAKQQDSLQFHNSLSHEVFHAVHSILKRKGFKLTNASEEAYAYLIGWITEKILM